MPADAPQVAAAARDAVHDPYGARDEVITAASRAAEAGEAGCEVIVVGWAFSPSFSRTLLVRHPRLGWLSPGGRLHKGETPIAGAKRETFEETGIPGLHPMWDRPAAVLGESRPVGRRFGFAYPFVIDEGAPLTPEPDQPAKWFDLDSVPTGVFPLDAGCMHDVAMTLSGP